MISVRSLMERLSELHASEVTEAGTRILQLVSEDHLHSRYITQVAERAFREEYESVDEVIASLQALVDRDPPIVEPKRQPSPKRIVLPEFKVLQIRSASIEALVTTGPLQDEEIVIQTTASFLPYLWIHATLAAYNLVPVSSRTFTCCDETFFVLEPMRQINATWIARSFHCVKPQVDQVRRGKGDVTIHTLKGQLIHALFDKILEGQSDLEAAYSEVFPSFLLPIASVTDDFFDEQAFHAEVLRHAAGLQQFVANNPQLLLNTQLELKRYSATLGIQGRIDALFRHRNKLDILELKTGKEIRAEDHAQLFIYRLLLSDWVRRWQRTAGEELEITSRLISSTDGSYSPMRLTADFHRVIDSRNMLVASQRALGEPIREVPSLYEGYKPAVCNACPSWTRRRCKDTSDILGDRPNAAVTPELDYFRKFTRLVERERWNTDQDIADLLDDSRLDLRVRNFRTICGARIVEDGEPFTFAFDQNTSDLQPGDMVLVHAGRISSTDSYHGYVKHVEPQRIHLSIPLKNIVPALLSNQEWMIDRFPSDLTSEASHTALYDFLVAPMDEKKRAILGIGESHEAPAAPHLHLAPLNQSQAAAVEAAVDCRVYHLIWGPPGTGKTRVIPEIVRRAGGTVLLGAFTNTAVDKMLMALIDADPSMRFLRFGRSSDSPELESRLRNAGLDPKDYFTEDVARSAGSIARLKHVLSKTPVLAATAHRAATTPFLRTRAFEMSIVDEAAQLTEPLTLGLILRARRFVLIGDDCQLPPVVRTRGLSVSMFERLKLQCEQGSPGGLLTMLDIQYRMHPEIMDVPNRLFYHGRLQAGITPGERQPVDNLPVEFVPVEARSSDDERKNDGEAAAVESLVRMYLHDFRVRPHHIGIVSPFRAQVVLLRQRLAGTGVSVDTVERFQGSEREIMILSLVRSRATGFVFDDRRLNVAITRARRKLVFVAHPDLFRNSKYAWISTYTETLRTAGTI